MSTRQFARAQHNPNGDKRQRSAKPDLRHGICHCSDAEHWQGIAREMSSPRVVAFFTVASRPPPVGGSSVAGTRVSVTGTESRASREPVCEAKHLSGGIEP